MRQLLHAEFLAVGLAVGLAGVLAGGLMVGLAGGLAVGLADAIRENLKTGRASFLTRGAFGLLVACHAFLVWYSYLGGWRLF